MVQLESRNYKKIRNGGPNSNYFNYLVDNNIEMFSYKFYF